MEQKAVQFSSTFELLCMLNKHTNKLDRIVSCHATWTN